MKKGIIAGNFDVIHPGYIAMFKECVENCDCLIVLLHTDPSIERPHKLKPILSPDERKDMLMSLRYVDDVIRYTYDHTATIKELEKRKPPFYENLMKTVRYAAIRNDL